MKKNADWPKELVLIDFNKKKFEYYNIEIISVGYNDMQVIFHSGRLTGKGISRVYQFKGENAYAEAMKLAFQRLKKKKEEGFIDKEHIITGLNYAFELNKKEATAKKKSQTKQKKKSCDFCNKDIDNKLYRRINLWARNEGNWDFSEDSPLYKKVVCIECQMNRGIFQKKVDVDTNF